MDCRGNKHFSVLTEGGEMKMKFFPLDCSYECPYYKACDMSIDDWVSYCDLLKKQIDDCDGWCIRYRCPLEVGEDKVNQNEK